MKFNADYVRVYFNRKEEAPKAWSIDFGPGTAEICCSHVVIEGAAGNTKFDQPAAEAAGPAPDRNSPRAWIDFSFVQVEILNDAVFVRPFLSAKSADKATPEEKLAAFLKANAMKLYSTSRNIGACTELKAYGRHIGYFRSLPESE